MRIKDVEKKERIIQSSLDLIFEEGIHNFSFGKMCEKAGVSSGTPYVYYKNKKDMLSQLFNHCYNVIFKEFKNCLNGKNTKENIYNSVNYLLKQLIEHPKEYYYIECIFLNRDLVNEEDLIDNFNFKEVKEIYDSAVKEDLLITKDYLTLIALVFRPGIFYIATERDVKLQDLEDLIRISVDSVLK